MKHLSDEFILQEIEYLDPELNDDREFRRIRRRSQEPGIVIKILFGLLYLSFAIDAAALLFAYVYCRP